MDLITRKAEAGSVPKELVVKPRRVNWLRLIEMLGARGEGRKEGTHSWNFSRFFSTLSKSIAVEYLCDPSPFCWRSLKAWMSAKDCLIKLLIGVSSKLFGGGAGLLSTRSQVLMASC